MAADKLHHRHRQAPARYNYTCVHLVPPDLLSMLLDVGQRAALQPMHLVQVPDRLRVTWNPAVMAQ